MKIATFGLDIQPGKYQYRPEAFDKLVEKFSPQKVSPYSVEFLGEDVQNGDALVFNPERRFDLIFMDLEKLDKRLSRCENQKEKDLLVKAQNLLEKEILLCDCPWTDEDAGFLKNTAFITYKPVIGKENISDMVSLIKEIMDKAGVFLFFTAGKKEVHAWELKKGATAVEAAGRIHSDLARGFIKAEIVNCKVLSQFFNMAEAKAKGLVRVVDRDYIVEDGDIIEIKFNV